jgi:hypothetical protein
VLAAIFMVLLEQLRHNELGTSYFSLVSKPDHKIYLAYQSHTNKAFYYTLNDLVELESSKLLRIGTGNETHSAISFWFLALESYLNCLIKIVCLKKNIEFRVYKNQDLGKRLGSLVDLLELDKKEFNETGIIAKLNEFCFFRNELFHDRHFAEEVEFKKTMFSKIPVLSKQVDTFQALLIYIEITSLLRYSIPGIDSMPDTIIKNDSYALWEKLDICYEGILKPALLAGLKKHNIFTDLSLDLPKVINFKSSVLEKGDIQSYITAEQEEEYFIQTNDLVTHHVQETYQNFVNKYNLKPNTFRIAKTVISD